MRLAQALCMTSALQVKSDFSFLGVPRDEIFFGPIFEPIFELI